VKSPAAGLEQQCGWS